MSPLLTPLPWRPPQEVLQPFAEEPYALALLSDGSARGRWSYLAWRPTATFGDLAAMRTVHNRLTKPSPPCAEHPPFQGGAAGLATYEWGATLDPAMPSHPSAWPALAGGVYEHLLAFDHWNQRVWAVGRNADQIDDLRTRFRAQSGPPADFDSIAMDERESDSAHRRSVAEVIQAIVRGDLFQANIARAWTGRLPHGIRPVDILQRLLAQSPAPFAGYFRLPDRAVVSNSPERFLRVAADGWVQARPIKGTRPRGSTPTEDQALADALSRSAKDRAENLMIVDLMRNDLSRLCRPGTVSVETFCALETYANVHHLVSGIVGRLAEDADALDLFAAAFPPGSITGAPKIQAMKEIVLREPARGPYCGSLFWAGADGAFDSSVLIRTLAFEREGLGWRFETRAGGGITADSDPDEETQEANAKVAAIRRALALASVEEAQSAVQA